METKQPELWAVQFITFPAATIFIFLRLFSRRLMKIPFWWDDFLAMACYAMALIWVVMLPIWIQKGLGLHIREVKSLTIEEASEATKLLLYIGELVYASALFFAKASILCFYWRMFRVSNIKLPIQILLVCSVIWIIIRTFMGIFHCVPVQAFWKSNIPNSRCDIEDSKFFFGTILVHVIIDIAILVLPIMQIRKLQLPKLQKIGISLMFCFGSFICGAAMAIIVESTKFDAASEDITWNLTNIIIWACVEVNLVTVSACLPTCRPAFLYLFTCANPNASLSSGSHSYGLSQSGKKSIRMSNLRKTMDADDSSTYQLADSVKGGGSLSDFETHALDRQRGTHTKITGLGSVDMGRDDIEVPRTMSEGILVKNETVVRVSEARPRGPF